MPGIEQPYPSRKALLWTAQGVDNYGQYKRSIEAIELDVEWLDRKSESLDAQGNSISLDATVGVGIEIAVGSTMWKGSIRDLVDSLLGTGTDETLQPASNLMFVATYEENHDIKGRNVARSVGLKKLSSLMPTAGSS